MISHSTEISTIVHRNDKKRKIASILFILFGLCFLGWRLTIFNPDAFVTSFLLWLAAAFGFCLGLSVIFASWSYRQLDIPPLTSHKTVDVYIPVYTEPAFMIEKTVCAAKGIRYPHETYLLDDGRREEIRQIAEKYGVHYVTRPDNQGAKAGNLNHAMKHSQGELIAVFDADHIPQRESLEKLIGFFDNPRIAMAQTPQCYYNEDAFLYRDVITSGAGRRHDQSYYYDVSQPGRDAHNASTGVGTGVIYRRKSLEDIGGFPEATLTEDLHTSCLLQKKGWQTCYLNEPIAWGVAAADVPEYTRTRHRWYYGNIQVLRMEKVPFCRNLTWRQKLSYLCLGIKYCEGLQHLLYVFIPIYCALWHVVPFKLTVFNFLTLLIGDVVLINLSLMVGCGFHRYLSDQLISIGRMHINIMALWGLFGRKMPWNIARKNVLGKVSLALLLPQFVVIITGVLSLILIFSRWARAYVADPETFTRDWVNLEVAAILTSPWIAFNVWRASRWVYNTIHLTDRTNQEYMFEIELAVLNVQNQVIGITRRLSIEQCRVTLLPGTTPEQLVGQELRLVIPGHTLSLKIQSLNPKGDLIFLPSTPEDKDRLWKTLYSVDWHRQIRLAPYAHCTEVEGLKGRWEPVLWRKKSEGDAVFHWGAFLRKSAAQSDSDHLITALPLESGTPLIVHHLNEQRETQGFNIARVKQTRYSLPVDLNDNSFTIYVLNS